MFSPSKLRENAIEYQTAIQFPGEIIISFPGAYHAGFNHGFNIAEAVNFATEAWFELGRKAKKCLCRPFSVNIDVISLETKYLRQMKASGGSTAWSYLRCLCDGRRDFVVTECTTCGLTFHKDCIREEYQVTFPGRLLSNLV